MYYVQFILTIYGESHVQHTTYYYYSFCSKWHACYDFHCNPNRERPLLSNIVVLVSIIAIGQLYEIDIYEIDTDYESIKGCSLWPQTFIIQYTIIYNKWSFDNRHSLSLYIHIYTHTHTHNWKYIKLIRFRTSTLSWDFSHTPKWKSL